MGSRGWPFWLFVCLLVFLHFLLHVGFGLSATAPDLLTVAVLLASRRLRGAPAALLGLGLGLLQDALSLKSFGAEAVTQAVLGFVGARSRDLFMGESAAFVAVFLFVGKWLHDALFAWVSRAGWGPELLSRLLVEAPIAAVYSAACGVVALMAYRLARGER